MHPHEEGSHFTESAVLMSLMTGEVIVRSPGTIKKERLKNLFGTNSTKKYLLILRQILTCCAKKQGLHYEGWQVFCYFKRFVKTKIIKK
jgi:hypothetical protein